MALTGRSGSGKTTILRLIAGLEGWESGTLNLSGKDLTRLPPEKRGIGYVFQETELFPSLDILENAAFGLRMRGFDQVERAQLVMPWLERVGLSSRAHDSIFGLSGGERQRIAFTRSLCINPALILLDEPFTALDPTLRTEMRKSILDLLSGQPVPVLLVSHDAEDALELGAKVIQLVEAHTTRSWQGESGTYP